MKVTIDRSKWLRGEGEDKSYLLRATDGKMCCLGFLGLACGLTEDEIRDCDTPLDTRKYYKFPAGLLRQTEDGVWVNSIFSGLLMGFNDSEEYSEEEREAELTQLFKLIGIELEFTDGGSIDR